MPTRRLLRYLPSLENRPRVSKVFLNPKLFPKFENYFPNFGRAFLSEVRLCGESSTQRRQLTALGDLAQLLLRRHRAYYQHRLKTYMDDLGSFLEAYERSFPREVLHIRQKIERKYEVTALVGQMEKKNRFPILIFDNVWSNGQRSSFSLVTFTHSSRQRIAFLLDTTPERIGNAYIERLQRRTPPVLFPL